MRRRDVVVLGGGLSGLVAALGLRDLDVEVLDAAGWVGGRTRSTRIPGGPWINYGAQYMRVDVHRWEHGHPQHVRGLMKHFPLLAEPADGIVFAGDYTWPANMEGAVRSGQRAAAQVRATL